MNPQDDDRLSADLRRALHQGAITTRAALEHAVKSGALMHLPGVGYALFREAEAWLRKTATTELVKCPRCDGIGVVHVERKP